MASVKAIEARGFSFRYPESTAGIGPLDWAVEEGSFQLLVGATGSGKTTLLGSCKPAIAPAGVRAGSLQVFGRSVEKLDARLRPTCIRACGIGALHYRRTRAQRS